MASSIFIFISIMFTLFDQSHSYPRFADAIKAVKLVEKPKIPPKSFLINKETIHFDDFEEFYIPFDYVNEHAKIMFVGITPGATQWKDAVCAMQRAINNAPIEQALKIAKSYGAFSGKARKNLVAQLDHFKINEKFRLTTCDQLFDLDCTLAHFTSVFVNPMYKNGKGLGEARSLSNSKLLQDSLRNGFIREVNFLKDAVIFPLGVGAKEAISFAVKQGWMDDSRVIAGLVHPSGANMARIQYILGLKSRDEMRGANNPDTIDKEVRALLEKLSIL